MKHKQRKIGDRVQLVVDEMRHLLGHVSTASADVARVRSLQLTKLEERVLMSASPMAMIAEVATVAMDASPLSGSLNVEATDSSTTNSEAIETAKLQPALSASQTEVTSNDSTNDSPAVQGIELIVIDSRVQDADTLLTDLLNSTHDIRLLRLDADRDGLAQITEKLEQLGNVSAIHLLTHGSGGEILLGSTVLNASTLAQHAPEFLAWQHNLTANADLLIYGCDVAGTPEGKDFITSLAQLTATDVAASADTTGSAEFGGNWDLEYATGVIETTALFTTDVQQNWLGKLAVINVTTFADVVDGNVTSVANLQANKGADGFISLREAILAINAGAGGDTINLGSGTYTLSIAGAGEDAAASGDLDILKTMTILGTGSGTTIIDANGIDRVFHILGANGQLTLMNLTVQGGDAGSGSGGGMLVATGANQLTLNSVVASGNSAANGAGIDNAGTLSLMDVTISNNGNQVSTSQGGGLRNTANASLTRVTLSGNRADTGGGIYNDFGTGNLTLTNVTVSGNTAAATGGGLYTLDPVTVTNSTFTLNTSDSGGGVRTLGTGATVSLKNTIVAGNIVSIANSDLSGSFLSSGNNLIGNGTGQTNLVNGVNGDKVGTSGTPINPLLGSLQGNGGNTYTHALLMGSIAINAGTATGSPTTDQRSVARVGQTDIGAYEYVPTFAQTGELAVNQTTGQLQDTSGQTRGSTQSVSITPSGNYVVVWTSNQSTGGDTNGRGVLMRTFRPDGTPLTGEIQVNQTTTNDQQWATVSTDDAGNGVVVWTSTAQDNGSTTGIYARRFNATGALVGNEFLVNTTPAGSQENAVVDMSGSGAFVVVWSGNGAGDTNGIFYRRFDANGTPLDATERRANATNRGVELAPSIAMNDAGQFAIAWQVAGDVFLRNFSANGNASTADIQVDFPLVNAYGAAVGIDATGRTIVVNRIDDFFLAPAGVWGRSFNSDGTERHAWVSVATAVGSDITSPSIATDDAGNFIVTYQGSGDGSGNAVFVKRYDADFNPLGITQQANTTTAGNQQMSSVAMLDPNNYVVVWSGQGPSDSDGVFARQFSIVGAAPLITSNGGGATASVNVAENTTAVTTVVATDADLPAQVLTYSIGVGADSANFTIGSSSGVLSFISVPDFENPSDVGAGNVYDVIVQVSDGTLIDTQTISVTVTNTNDTAPVVTGGQTFAVSELASNGTSLGSVAATDADGSTTFSSWTITAGNNGGVFGINAATGQLTVVDRTNLNFDINPSYVLSMTVSDGINTSVVQTVTVNVIDSPNIPPVANDDSYTVLEGGTLNQTVVNGWINSNWQFRRQLIFNNSAGSTNLINNAVLVKLHSSASDAIQIDYSQTQNAGQDLRFVDSDGTPLAYQIEQWDESGYSYVWVRVPQINAGSTTDSITMYYGNPTIAAGQSPASVWTNNLVGVYHMDGTGVDSTFYANDGISTNVVTAAGQIARSGAFDGLNSLINAQSASSVDNIFVGGGAISAWINPVSWGEGGYGRIADKGTSTTGALGWGFQVAGTNASDGYLVFESDFTTTVGRWRTAAGTVAQNSWQNVAVVYDNSSTSNVPKIYMNGVQLALTVMSTPAGVAQSDAAQDLYIGNRSGSNDRTFSGRIDEVRISNTALTGDQITADYKSAQGTFITAGSVQSGPGGLLDNDFDVDGNVLTVSLVSGPAHAASFTLNMDGSFTYVHDGSETTADSFVYRASDGSLTDTATVALSITPVNDNAPVITSNGSGAIASINVAENATAVTTVTATDADLPAQTLTYSISGGADAAKFTINSTNGTLAFVTAPNFETPTDVGTNNVYDVTVRVTDGTFTDTQAIAVTVNDVNEFSVGTITDTNGSANAVNENSTNGTIARVTAFATDADATTNTVTYSLDNSADGRFAINTTTGVVTIANGLLLNYETATSHNIVVRATSADTSSTTKSFTINVVDVNEPPSMVITQLVSTLPEDTKTSLPIVIATIAINDDALGSNTLSLTGADAAKFQIVSGNLRLRAGTVLDAETQTHYTVDVVLRDTTLSTTSFSVQTVNLTITNIDEAPTADAGGPYTISEGGTLTVVAGPSVDPEGQSLSYTWDIDGDGLFNDATGSTAALTWHQLTALAIPVNDNGTRTIAVRVTDPAENATIATSTLTISNTAPTVNVSGNATATSGAPFTISFAASDPGADTITTYRVTWGDGITGNVTGTAISASHTYLNPGGTRSITVQAIDEDGTFAMTGGPLIVTVLNTAPSNPTLSNIVVAGLMNGATVGTLSFTDPDIGDSHTLTVNDNRFRVDGSTLRLKPGQQLNPLTEPTVTLTVTVTDANGAAASSSFILQVNNAPISAGDAYAVDGTQQLSISSPSVGVLANDTDADGDTFSASLVSGPTHAATFGLNPNGTFWYRATTGYSGVDTFSYVATDGVNVGAVTTVTFTVNQPATLGYTALISSIPEHQTLTSSLRVGTVNVTDDGIGTNTITLASSDAALFELDANNNLSLKSGLAIDYAVQTQFQVTILLDDPAIAGTPDSSRTLIIAVQDLNEVPTASGLANVFVLEDCAPGTINTASAFHDPDGGPLSYSVQIIAQSPGLIKTIGINQSTGVISYSLKANANGAATIQVTAKDPSLATVSSAFQLTVQPVNDAPVAQNYSATVNIDKSLAVSAPGIAASITDVDGNPTTITLVAGPANGSVVLQADGSFVYTPVRGFQGIDTFRYIASDGVLVSNVGIATINVIPQFIGPSNGTSGNSNGFGSQASTTTTTSSTSTSTASNSQTSSTSSTVNSGTANSTSTTTAAVSSNMALTLSTAAFEVSASSDERTDNNDDVIYGMLPSNGLDDVVRFGSAAVISASNDSSRSTGNDLVRRTYGVTERYDFDRVFSQAASNEEMAQLNAQRESLYRQLSERVVEQSESVAEQLENSTQFKGRVVGSVGVVTTGFSVGYLFWAIRGGMLVSGLLAQVPAWTMLDPLLVIDGDQKDEDKESLQNLMDRQQAKMNRNEETAANPVTLDITSET